jgi:tRNA-Thr(GGU) m(6)t(6)A37 methyltransferase TsaA
MFTVDPIGYFHTSCTAHYDVPRQGVLSPGNEGVIELKEGCQFEQALEGLDGFDRLWVIYRFHHNTKWKPKVLPPRGGKKQGVFATRSPHRPNFIGLSCVELVSIKGLKLFVVNHDLIDGTPILDVKPYLNYADAVLSRRQGWIENLPPDKPLTLRWSPLAQEQIDYLESLCRSSLRRGIEHRLAQSPLPYPNNRVKQIQEGSYELAYQTWRIYYAIDEDCLHIDSLASGYDEETLAGKKKSKWEDVPLHQAFVQRFPSY